MTMITRLMGGAAAVAALAIAAPAAAQYPGYATPYGYAQPYGNAYGYHNNYAYNPTQMAANQCTAAVQSRLNNRTGMAGILGAVLGANINTGRVLSVTRVNPNRNMVRVRGLASSGTVPGYGPYGVGAYGAAGYAYQPDLSFTCSVDYNGRVRDVDITRRR